jgi:hypothetical protein
MNEHPLEKIIVDMDSLIKTLENLHEEISKFQWIKCSDQLPEEGIQVLTIEIAKKNSVFPLRYKIDYIVELPNEKIWACRLDYEMLRVTHWMPLPKPPQDI